MKGKNKTKRIIINITLSTICIILFSCVNLNVNINETISKETKILEEQVVDMMKIGENLNNLDETTYINTEKVRYEDREKEVLYCETTYDKINISDSFAFKYQALNAELLNFNKKSDDEAKTFLKQYGEEVRELIKERNDNTLILSYESAVNIKRNDEKIFSFANDIYSYTGGAHGNYGTICYNYDTKSGMALKNDDVFINKDLLYERLIKKLAEEESKYEDVMLLFEEYPETIKDMINQNEEFSMIIYDDAVEVLFDPYLIGPWSSGTITVRFNYEENKDMLNDSLFDVN